MVSFSAFSNAHALRRQIGYHHFRNVRQLGRQRRRQFRTVA
jgi:hypothetical protein